jgi:hypothetical protein
VFRIGVSKKGSYNTRNRKILVFQPNFTSFELDIVFTLSGMAGVTGGPSLPRQMATDL